MLSEHEWEALCKRCGKCCYIWLSENTRSSTEACSLLDKETKQCTEYKERFAKKLEAYKGARKCAKLNEEDLKMYYETGFLPADCAYIKYFLEER